jgi:hypothetical protein
MKLAAIAGPIVAITALTSTAHADKILVFGDHAGRARIAEILSEAGHNATSSETMPERLDGHDVVWHVGAVVPLTETEQKLLAAFVNHGGGAYLTGDGPGAEAMNASVQTIVAATVFQGDITLSATPQPTSARHQFSPAVIGDISTSPNELYFWDPTVSGAIEGMIDGNVLTRGADGRATSAAWGAPDLSESRGKLVVMMDSGWISSPYSITRIVYNLDQFLREGVPCDDTCPASDPDELAGRGEPMPDEGTEPDDTDTDEDEVDNLAYAGCSAGGGASGGGLLLLALAFVGLARRRGIS